MRHRLLVMVYAPTDHERGLIDPHLRPHLVLHSLGQLPLPVKLSTVDSRTFPVAAAKLWNSLPDDIVLADSLSTFRRQLKHYLF